jgi:hypothetical protein
MIIGLMGHAQTGKDSTADILVDHYGFERVAFADALRDCLYALNPIVRGDGICYDAGIRLRTYVDHGGWDISKQQPEVRRLLQVMGTEVGREIIDPNVWAKITLRKIGELLRHSDVVVTDVRFPNEADAVEKSLGALVRLHRPGVEAVNAHVSETALDGRACRWEIFNNHDLAHLHTLVDDMLKVIL